MAPKRTTEKERNELEHLMEVRDPQLIGPMQCSVTRLHGFFTSIISGPIVLPSEWLPVVFGDDAEHVWETIEQAKRAMTLLMHFYDDVCRDLEPGRRRYTVMIDRITEDSDTLDLVDDWCIGYTLGVKLRAEEWEDACEAPELYAAFAPIVGLADSERSPHFDPVQSPKAYAALRDILPDCAIEIYNWWRARFAASDPEYAMPVGTVRRAAAKVSPNAPCPCGSGKKYKRCCSPLRAV